MMGFHNVMKREFEKQLDKQDIQVEWFGKPGETRLFYFRIFYFHY